MLKFTHMLVIFTVDLFLILKNCFSELPISSPLIHGVIRVISQWQKLLKEELDSKGPPPPDYIPGCYIEDVTIGPPIQKYRCLLDKSNTPFQ